MAKKKRREPLKLSEELQSFILQSEMTRYRIAKLAGMSQAQLHRFLATGRGISVETLDRIAAVLRLRLIADPDADE